MREEVIEAMADAIARVAWENPKLDFSLLHARAAFDALVPYVVLRDQMEQVGWRCDQIVGPKRWLVCPHSAPCGPVYIIREVPDAV